MWALLLGRMVAVLIAVPRTCRTDAFQPLTTLWPAGLACAVQAAYTVCAFILPEHADYFRFVRPMRWRVAGTLVTVEVTGRGCCCSYPDLLRCTLPALLLYVYAGWCAAL